MNQSRIKFDMVATEYTLTLKKLPVDYIQFIKENLEVRTDDRIIDLGCGSGLLTFELLQLSNFIEGLDSSSAMIQLARKKDQRNQIKWICKPIEDFYIDLDSYPLIISFESFHLFPSKSQVLLKCYMGLKSDGHFAVGWCKHFWEDDFRKIIIETFREYGIIWGEWDYQSSSNINEILEEWKIPFKGMELKSIETYSEENVFNISHYLTCIDKALDLNNKERENLEKSLLGKFLKCTGKDKINGFTKYYLKYYRK